MPGSMLKLGPFRRGLNNFSDPTSIADDELAVCKNFDYDVDGTLISRPPVVQDSTSGPVAGQNIDLLGHFIDTSGAVYLIGSCPSGIYYRSSGVWTLITNTIQSDCAIQYLNKMWIPAVPGSASPGGSWSPTGGWTAVASMPKGSAICTFKERLWIAAGSKEVTNGSRVYFSAIADGTTWNPADFVDISPGDGQKVIDLYALSTNLYLFKSGSTYVLQYDLAPTKGVVNAVSRTIGVEDIRCIIQYENILYVYNDGYLYELINYQFNKVNIRVNLVSGASGTYSRPVSLSLVGNRVVLFYYGNVFVFYLLTRTWSQWVTAVPISRLWQVPNSMVGSTPYTYVANCNLINDERTFNFLDGYAANRSESVHARIETKIYDFNAPNLFKKLYWWGADILSSNTVDTAAVPVIYTFTTTWAQMASYTWGQVINNTWARPAEIDVAVRETISMPGAVRKFLKIMKAVRFRNIYFVLDFTLTDWQNPVRVYSITPVVNMKEQVPRSIN